MKNQIVKIFIVVTFIVLLGGAPFFASAQLGIGIPCTPVTPCPITDIPTVFDTPALAAITAARNANQVCSATEQAYFAGDTAATIGFGGLSLISGGATVVAKLSAKVAAIDGFIFCRQSILNPVFLNFITPTQFTANQKQLIINDINSAIAHLKAQEEPIKNQLTLASQGFWKSLVYNILIKTTQSVSTHLLNQLTNNYKIKDFAQYADAVATQVYDNEFIQNNYSGKNADQMIIRSMLNNPAIQKEIQPAIFQRADASLGFDPNAMSTSNPNFYSQMAMVGSGQNSPFVQQMVLTDQTQQIHNKALQTAQAEIAQSSGLKTPRTCVGSISQQQSIDISFKAANNQLKDRQALLTSLTQAQAAGQNVNANDIARAQADVIAAEKNLQTVPNSVGSGSAAIDICKAIVSPPSLINQGINEALHSIGQNLGTYNDNNLPFFINAITNVATQVGNSLIFGGSVDPKHILDENVGTLVTGAALVANGISAEHQIQQNNNLIFESSRNSDISKNMASYNLQWDATALANATAVSVTGPGLPANTSGLAVPQMSGAINATIAVPGTYTYTLVAYGKSKADVLATVRITITPTQVAGASASKPSTPNIRGPIGITPRGSAN